MELGLIGSKKLRKSALPGGGKCTLELVHLRHSLESDFARLLVACSTIGDGAFAELRVQSIDGSHKSSVARFVKQVRLMGLRGSEARQGNADA